MSIRSVQDLYIDNSIKNELVEILSNCQCLVEIIKQLEKSSDFFRSETNNYVKVGK